MVHSSAAVELIKKFEGLKLEAYLCPAGFCTIGYGHTYKVFIGDKITDQQAVDLLNDDLNYVDRQLNSLPLLKVTQCQWDSLVSFVFNCGFHCTVRLSKMRTQKRAWTWQGITRLLFHT